MTRPVTSDDLGPYVLRVEARPDEMIGQFVKSFDFDAHKGQGFGIFTADPKQAMHFSDKGAAFEFWRTRSKRFPTRADGKPNRPLTASSVSICPLADFT